MTAVPAEQHAATLIVALDPRLRRYLLAALLAGRRELRRNGIHSPEGFDRLAAALAAPNGHQRPQPPVPDNDPDSVLMNYQRAAGHLGVSDRTVRRLVANGHLPAVRIGRRVLIRAADVDLFAGARHAG